jgi:hypothetical protein
MRGPSRRWRARPPAVPRRLHVHVQPSPRPLRATSRRARLGRGGRGGLLGGEEGAGEGGGQEAVAGGGVARVERLQLRCGQPEAEAALHRQQEVRAVHSAPRWRLLGEQSLQ